MSDNAIGDTKVVHEMNVVEGSILVHGQKLRRYSSYIQEFLHDAQSGWEDVPSEEQGAGGE